MGIKKFVTDSSNIKKYFELHPHSLTDVKEDLAEARETIQTKLGRDAGNHLCLPWTIGNSKTIKIAEELGIKSCFWGVFPNNKNLKSNRDPFLISRIKNDFIFRLPGEERKSLLSIYYYKMKRRGSEEHIF